jgi:signal transduction histidine kinase
MALMKRMAARRQWFTTAREDAFLVITAVITILALGALWRYKYSTPSPSLLLVDEEFVIFMLLVVIAFGFSFFTSSRAAAVIQAAFVGAVVWANSFGVVIDLFIVIWTAALALLLYRIKAQTYRLYEESMEKSAQLERTMQDLRQVDARKDEMMFIASHDLRTPVSIIRSNLATIKEGYAGKVNKEAQIYIDAAYRASERLRHLLEDLLESSILESKERVTLKPAQVEEILHNAMAPHAKAAGHIKLIYPHKPYTTPQVLVDERMLQRAFENIITNALKFTKEGYIKATTEHRDGVVIVHIEDTGIGIASEEHEQLFTKFYRGSNAASVDARGSGLGLYITKQIVQRLRGRIYFSSQVNKGTTFHIELPAVNA